MSVTNKFRNIRKICRNFLRYGALRVTARTPRQSHGVVPWQWDAGDTGRQEGRRLYVVGYARSGTTILGNVLNSSPDILVFAELGAHRMVRGNLRGPALKDYLRSYNQRRERELRGFPIKGSRIHERHIGGLGAEDDLDAFLNAVGTDHRYVGDKIALNMLMHDGLHDVQIGNEFIEWKDRDIFLLPLRRPSENLYSLQKMFPDVPVAVNLAHLGAWTLFALDRFLTTSRSFLVFHDDVGPGLVEELEELLSSRLHFPTRRLVGLQRSDGQFPVCESETVLAGVHAFDAAYEAIYKCFDFERTILKRQKLLNQIPDAAAEIRRIVEGLGCLDPTPLD